MLAGAVIQAPCPGNDRESEEMEMDSVRTWWHSLMKSCVYKAPPRHSPSSTGCVRNCTGAQHT